MSELKPCPFCGGEPYVSSFLISPDEGRNWAAACNGDNAPETDEGTPEHYVQHFGQTRDEAVANWNRRASEPSEADLKAKLEKALNELHECEEYFDNRADADCDQDGFIPNEEMSRLSSVREIIKELSE